MEKKQNVPALRFPGFSGEWDMKYFKKLVVLERGGSPRPIDDYITTDDNGLNWVKIGDAPANGSYITHTAEKIKPEGLSKTRQVFPGDLILSNSMSFGKPYIMGIPGCIHDGWLLIRDEKHHFDLKYLCVLLGIPAMLRQYRALAAGSTVSNLNKELVGNTHVYIPDIVEQKKIGSFFDKLDQSIYWCENKIQKLQQFRQAMLTKLFPAEGASEPALRFRDCFSPWKTARLGDLGTTYGGLNGKTKKDFGHGAGRFVTYLNIFNNPIADLQGIEAVELDKTQNQVKYGDIFFTTSSETPEEVGMSSVWLGNDENVYLNSFCFGYRPLNNLYPYFMAYLLRSTSIRKKFIFLAQGISRYNISKNRVMDMYIPLPPIEEQKNIGDFLYSLDNFLSLQKEKLDKMRLLKAALLEKLFV